jgi:hypothetical protein
MLSNIRAKLLRFCDLSWKDLTNLKAWSKGSASFNSFGRENYSSPSLRVAKAESDGETICLCPIEQVLTVSAYALRPGTCEEHAQLAGDFIDAAIEREAQRAGISKLLIILPANHPATFEGDEWKTVKIFERKIPHAVVMGGVGISAQSQATRFLN